MDKSERKPQNPLESIFNTIVFSPKDHSIEANDAWIYGIVVGWGECTKEIFDKFNWDKKDIPRMEHLHREFTNLLTNKEVEK